MANELAVKVKVNLDTSAKALNDQLKAITDKTPVKIAVQVDPKSLTKSLKEAFGKDAANDIKKNLQSAFGGNDGKDIFKNLSAGANEAAQKAKKVAELLAKLHKLQFDEKTNATQYEGLKGSETRQNELELWGNKVADVREQYQKLFEELNKYSASDLYDAGFKGLSEQLLQEQELYQARRKDAELLAKSKTNTTSKYTSDEIKEEKAAIDQLISAQEKLDNLQVKYYNELKGGRTDNAVELVQPIQKASEELETAKKNAADLGIKIDESKRYMDALADSTTKVTMAQNNVNSALSGNSIKDQASDDKAAINQVISALKKRDELQVQYYNELKKSGEGDNANRINGLVKDANTTLREAIANARAIGVEFDKDAKYLQTQNEGLVKVNNAEQDLRKSQNESVVKARADEDKAALDAEKAAIESIIDAENRLAQATVNYNKAKASGNTDKEGLYLGEMTQANQDFAVATAAADKLGVAWRTNKERLDALHESQVKVAASDADFAASQTKAANATNSLNASISNTIDRANALNAVTQKNGAGKTDMTAFNQAFEEFNNIANDTSGKYSDLKVKSDALQKSFQKMGIAAGNINTALKDDSAITRTKTNFANLNAQITRFLNNNPRISSNGGIYAQFQALATATEECSGDIDKLRMKEAQLEAQSERLGLTTETLAGKFSRLFKEHFQTAAVMAGIHLTQQGFQQVYQNVVEVDTAMTELKKVTDETDATYNSFMQNAENRAATIGATLSDTINATADFARLGFNIEDASSVSDAALILKNVGDGISDVSDASEMLISTMQAFDIKASDTLKIVNEFNSAGNNFAISSGDVGEALKRSASALATANNTMEESIALATTMNRVIQDPETVGKFCPAA